MSNDDKWVGLPKDLSAFGPTVEAEARRIRQARPQPQPAIQTIPDRPFLWWTHSITGVDETLTNATTDREWNREYLGEWVDNPPRPFERIDSTPRISHIADSIQYAARGLARIWQPARRNRRKMPKIEPGTFIVISPLVAEELFPDAMVPFDKDLANKLANPVFITRWGHLYTTPIETDTVNGDRIWCWDRVGEKWDDLSEGFWAFPYSGQWFECKKLARQLHAQRSL